MFIKNTDRISLLEVYARMQECDCQHADTQQPYTSSSNERTDMIINNLVVLNNKAAAVIEQIQAAIQSGEEVDEWVSEKIAIATNMIGAINDYYAKFNTQDDVAKLVATAMPVTQPTSPSIPTGISLNL